MTPEIIVEPVPPTPTAVVAATTNWTEYPRLWRVLLDEVYEVVKAGPTRLNVMLYKDDRPSVEVGVTMDVDLEPKGNVVASRLPGGRVAHATHRGPYGRLGDTHKAIIDYCDQQGLKRTGQRWEIYGHHRDDRAELETEVVWQLA